MPKSKAQIQREEDELIKMFSSNVSKTSSANFMFSAFVAAATPLFAFIKIQQLDIQNSWHVMGIFTCIATYILQFSYGKSQFKIKSQIAGDIQDGVAKEVSASLGDKKISSQEKEDKVLMRKNQIAESASMSKTIFQTNMVFFGLVLIASFVFFKSWEPLANFIVSMVFSCGILGGLAWIEK